MHWAKNKKIHTLPKELYKKKYNISHIYNILHKQLNEVKRIIHISLFILIMAIYACEKDITVDLPNPESSIVVEGYIENGQVPYVILTQNSPYFEEVDLNSLGALVVTNARVTVSDGLNTDTLQFAFTPTKFPFAAYIGTREAEAGKNYKLHIVYLNDTVTAETYIPKPITLDSLVFRPAPQFIQDSVGYVWVYFHDHPNTSDYYRTESMILGKDSFFLHPFNSVMDDKLLNGQQYQFPTYHGITGMQGVSDSSSTTNSDDPKRFMFKAGEKVVIKISRIDVQTYQFWESIENQRGSNGNPFASPSTIKSNIHGGLGIWGGYGATIDTLQIVMPEE